MKNFIKKVFHPIIYSQRVKLSAKICQIAEINKWKIIKLNEAYFENLVPPILHGLDKNISSNLAIKKRMEIAAQHLVCVPNASTRAGFVKLATGEFLTESPLRDEDLKNNAIYRARYIKHKLDLDGDCYYLDTLFSQNYGHWLSDDLPRLVSALPYLPSSTRFIVSDPLPEFKEQTLAALGIQPQYIVPVRGFYETRCERLWYATSMDDMVWNSKNVLKVRDAIWKSYATDKEGKSELVYISRDHLSSKRLINEKEFLPLLQSRGFKINVAEKMSVSQQVANFYKAKLVLGAYGSGLINLLFCENAKVIELQDALYAHRPWHWRWASLLGIPYSCLFGSVAKSQGYLNVSFRIDPGVLEPFLDNAIASVDNL